MAWNEPGGGKKPQDPWRGGSNQGPPDLDEMIKKLHRKLTGKSGSGGGSPGLGGGFSAGLLIVALVVALVVTAASGFYRVEEAEQTVVLRFGKFLDIKGAGLRWNIPVIDEVLKVNIKLLSSHRHEASMLTKDQNIVDVELEVQYKISNPRDYFLKIEDSKDSLFQATESALRHVVGGEKMDSVLTERRFAVAQEVQLRLQEYLDRYHSGLIIQKVNIQNAHPPQEVKLAFDDVIKAKEDEERFINEAKAYRNKVIPQARGQKERILKEATAYQQEVIEQSKGEVERFGQLLAEYELAPEVTRQRLYFETIEQVLTKSTKILVDLEGGNNLVYLPLDKIMSNTANQQAGELLKNRPISSRNSINSASTNFSNSAGSSAVRTAPIREGR